jgi:hypothetical protein
VETSNFKIQNPRKHQASIFKPWTTHFAVAAGILPAVEPGVPPGG